MAEIPEIKPGDLVRVYSKIIEGDKERITPFQGVVIKIRGQDISKTFTVRKVSAGVGIERIFPLHSPMITKIEIKKRGRVRRAKLNYLRKRRGRRMKIKEAIQSKKVTETKKIGPEKPAPEPEEKAGEVVSGKETVEKV